MIHFNLSETMRRLLEVCVDTVDGVMAALEGGADRIELCSALELGGLTPSHGLIKLAQELVKNTPTKINVLIRPRSGDFVYSQREIEQMETDIGVAHQLGIEMLNFL